MEIAMIDKNGIDPEYIKDEVSDAIDSGWELFALENYIDACDHLNIREKSWAKKHLRAHIIIDIEEK
jgi:hypothetical protein